MSSEPLPFDDAPEVLITAYMKRAYLTAQAATDVLTLNNLKPDALMRANAWANLSTAYALMAHTLVGMLP